MGSIKTENNRPRNNAYYQEVKSIGEA